MIRNILVGVLAFVAPSLTTFAQGTETKLTASDGAAGDRFGAAVS
jgi:hypothetical protein